VAQLKNRSKCRAKNRFLTFLSTESECLFAGPRRSVCSGVLPAGCGFFNSVDRESGKFSLVTAASGLSRYSTGWRPELIDGPDTIPASKPLTGGFPHRLKDKKTSRNCAFARFLIAACRDSAKRPDPSVSQLWFVSVVVKNPELYESGKRLGAGTVWKEKILSCLLAEPLSRTVNDFSVVAPLASVGNPAGAAVLPNVNAYLQNH